MCEILTASIWRRGHECETFTHSHWRRRHEREKRRRRECDGMCEIFTASIWRRRHECDKFTECVKFSLLRSGVAGTSAKRSRTATGVAGTSVKHSRTATSESVAGASVTACVKYSLLRKDSIWRRRHECETFTDGHCFRKRRGRECEIHCIDLASQARV